MPTFLYRCPNTGLRVQGWIANDRTERDGDSFEAVTCPACGGVHLVNPQTGKVLGANDNAWAQQTLGVRSQLEAVTPNLARVRISGKPVMLPADLAMPFGLILHELRAATAEASRQWQ